MQSRPRKPFRSACPAALRALSKFRVLVTEPVCSPAKNAVRAMLTGSCRLDFHAGLYFSFVVSGAASEW